MDTRAMCECSYVVSGVRAHLLLKALLQRQAAMHANHHRSQSLRHQLPS